VCGVFFFFERFRFWRIHSLPYPKSRRGFRLLDRAELALPFLCGFSWVLLLGRVLMLPIYPSLFPFFIPPPSPSPNSHPTFPTSSSSRPLLIPLFPLYFSLHGPLSFMLPRQAWYFFREILFLFFQCPTLTGLREFFFTLFSVLSAILGQPWPWPR